MGTFMWLSLPKKYSSSSSRDMVSANLMMSTREMWPEPYHIMRPYMDPTFTKMVKEPRTRTSRPPKYYIVIAGTSVQYRPGIPNPIAWYYDGHDKTVPELFGEWVAGSYDPFPVDIYCIGNVIQTEILDVCCSCLLNCRRSLGFLIIMLPIGLHWLRLSQTSR